MKYKTLSVLSLSGLLFGISIPVANADTGGTSKNHAEEVAASSYDAPSNSGLTDDIIEKYDDYVQLDDNGDYFLDLPDSFAVDDDELQIVQDSIQQSNELFDEQVSASNELSPVATAAGASGGFSAHWWGVQLWLNGPATDKLNKLLVAGGGVSALTAAIMSWTGVGGAVAGVVAGAFAAGAGVANLCNWNDNGISIKSPHVGPVICWPR